MKGFTFTGREWDAEAGMYYYRARWYDPARGRFPSPDPLPARSRALRRVHLSPGGEYNHVGGNPVSRTDPTGLDYVYCTLTSDSTIHCPITEGCPPVTHDRTGHVCEYACALRDGNTGTFSGGGSCPGGGCSPGMYVNVDNVTTHDGNPWWP
ncbi:MAG: RHS repeat-associated core domain-containing protein [Candidatus Wallbacteria bacterium]|nr:RHS repeat-associated core domain-containing protein [Candidatus Wallbacteria bacterium]